MLSNSFGSDYSQVQDYNQIIMPQQIDCSDLPEAVVCGDIPYMKKVRNIFGSDLAGLIEELNRNEPKSMYTSKLGNTKVFISSVLEFNEIKFNAKGLVKTKSFENHLNVQENPSPSIQKAIKIAFERFSLEMGWKKETKYLSCNVVVQSFSDEYPSIKWHSDHANLPPFTKPEYSLVALLSDPNNMKKGWSGGDFLYTRRREFSKCSDRVIKKAKETQCQIFNCPNSPIFQTNPEQDVGILFRNSGMNHRITPLKGKGTERAERIIFAVFAAK